MATKKELKKYEKIALVCYTLAVIFLMSTIILSVILFNGEKNCEIEEVEEVEWECPMLLENGTYEFMGNGSLITPSGKELKCEVASDKY